MTPTTDFAHWWARVLTLRAMGEDRFEGGPAPSAFPRLYGGQLAAQALLAAANTVTAEWTPHSAHTAFLHGGDPAHPVGYRVARLRDSRALSTRRVDAEQDGRLLATTTASFHHPPTRTWLEHDLPSEQDTPPDPATLDSRAHALEAAFGTGIPTAAASVWPVEMRYADRTPWAPSEQRAPRNRLWLKASAPLPDTPATHAAALAFATDLPMFEPVLFPHDLGWAELITGQSVYGASLDHALWFHRPPRCDDWLLLDQISPVATGSRGLSRAEVRSPAGNLVATVVQEIAFTEPR